MKNVLFGVKQMKRFLPQNEILSFITAILFAVDVSAASIKSMATKILVTTVQTIGAPVVLYTDIVSGPNSGGENNNGIYLSIFGKNFGNGGLGTTTKVFINNFEVARYLLLGKSRARSDIQMIAVQIGNLGNPVIGTKLPIKVVVNNLNSNTDQSFTVNLGSIYYADNVTGIDTTTINTGGTFDAPFKTVQKKNGAALNFSIDSASVSGAWGRVRAGDFIVMRGKGVPWTDVGYLDYFLMALNKSGCAVGTICAQGGGTSSGPITVMGYPGEDVFINNVYNSQTDTGAISSADSARILEGKGHWINIVNLRVEGGNHDGAVNTQAGGTNWRVVNNELTAATAVNNKTAKAGGIAGDGHVTIPALGTNAGTFYLGNYIHDVFCGPDNSSSNFENHGIYIDGAGQYEIAFNRIFKIRGGNGIQTYANGTLGNNNVDGLNFHHNLIQNVGKHGINVADGSRNNFKIWNNIVLETDLSGIRFNTTELTDAKIYNNTFYNINRLSNPNHSTITNDSAFASATALDIKNNIFYPVNGSFDVLSAPLRGTITNNLWFGGTGTNPVTSYSKVSISTDPMFLDAATGDFHLKSTSPAKDVGTDASVLVQSDFDAGLRPKGVAFDIGAFEF